MLVYAPGLARWSEAFEAGLIGADVALLDGTFATRGEFDRAGPGHLSIKDSLPRLRARPGPRYLYTHLNNTNPYAAAAVRIPGAGVAADGELLIL